MVVLGATPVINTVPAAAHNPSFGADIFYKSDIVILQPITLPNHENASATVVGHRMGAVNEQSAILYSTKLAEQSFVTIALDLSFRSGSGGDPRNAVLPDVYAQPFSAAVDYLSTLGFVDHERIRAVHVCGSGSYVNNAAKIDTRIAA